MISKDSSLYWRAWTGSGIGFMTFGWDAGVLGGILLTTSFQSAMHNPSVTTVSMITSVFLLGSWLGCILISIFGLSQGRRTWILLGNGVEIVGSIISAASYELWQLIAGRVLIGIGNRLLTSMCPVYVAEMAVDAGKRGRGVDMLIVMATTGAALAYWVDFGMIFTSGQVVWRFPVAFQTVIALISITILLPLPDTPRWYYAKGRVREADKVLLRLCNEGPEGQFEKVKSNILASLEIEKGGKDGLQFKHFFWDTSTTQSGQYLAAASIDFLFYYTTTIFQSYIGLSALTASGLSGALNTVECIFNWISIPFLEKMGRRQWLIVGGTLQSVFLAALVGLIAHPGPKTAAAAAMLFGFVVALGPGWAPFAYVYASEIMPLRYRHLGFSLSISCQWIFALVTVFAGPIAVNRGGSHGWTTWLWFLVFNAISVPFVYLFCPETQGKTLEEIDLVFVSGDLLDSAAAHALAGNIRTSSQSNNVDALPVELGSPEDVEGKK